MISCSQPPLCSYGDDCIQLELWLVQAVLEQDRDLQHHQLPMLDAEQHHVGDLTVTVRAVQAFRSMHA